MPMRFVLVLPVASIVGCVLCPTEHHTAHTNYTAKEVSPPAAAVLVCVSTASAGVKLGLPNYKEYHHRGRPITGLDKDIRQVILYLLSIDS